ncbi:9289_t:CDS:2 [Dentiscutata heterogama]|uniref:9289_t:CDS:1 n=1 Tax=Dentiscutata heterogama TaxID=1316150 RepID=A0ACA9KIC4_9GLOM|nr:9289_t:CDS:2 [Dentiscutata heterogama]
MGHGGFATSYEAVYYSLIEIINMALDEQFADFFTISRMSRTLRRIGGIGPLFRCSEFEPKFT